MSAEECAEYGIEWDTYCWLSGSGMSDLEILEWADEEDESSDV